jgi:Arc/MetJ-type ribon-helix-helix transcriptional regulator
VRAKIKAWIARLPKRERPLTAQQMTDLYQHMDRKVRLAVEESIYDAVSSAVQDAMSDAESTIESAIEYHMPRPDEVDLSELEDAVANMRQELRSLMTWMRME